MTSSSRAGSDDRRVGGFTNAITLTSTTLLIEPAGLPRTWQMQQHLAIPVGHVRAVRHDPDSLDDPDPSNPPRRTGLRWIGMFADAGSRSFWNIDGPGRTIVIDLDDEFFSRVVLTVDTPIDMVRTITAAIRPR